MRSPDTESHGNQSPGNAQAEDDVHSLADMGHSQTLSRKFNSLSLFFLSFIVLGTWSTAGQSLSSALGSGGPALILWGLVLVTICNVCVAVSLAELCSSMPTALGQAYWVSRLWPGKWGRFTSYLCAWINTFGWWTLSASQLAFMTSFLLSMKVNYDPEWEGAELGWVQFLLYFAMSIAGTLANIGAGRRDAILPFINNFVGVWFVALFCVFSLALVISVGKSELLSFQPASFVFATWINQDGWSDGVAFFLGLVQAAFSLTAFDAAVHMAEEIPAPRKNVPRILWSSVVSGAVTGFLFMIVCMYCIQDFDTVLNGPTGIPFVDLLVQTVGLDGATALLALFIFNGIGMAFSIITSSSRLTWGLARDGGLPWGEYFGHVDETWRVPVRALWLQGIITGLVGILYTFANTVLQAIVSVTTIALTISYAIPIVVLLGVGRDKLPPGGEFPLGRFGPVINVISLIYCCVTTVFFFFPASPDPTAEDMNYAIAVFGVMMVIALVLWVIEGRHKYLRTGHAEERMEQARRLEVEVLNGIGKGESEKANGNDGKENGAASK
ncbi:hypothetical protein MCOR23_005856 [Pyricularia oryzae]|nr:hypothetical protein MCOR23_005856 [Pyricularia oryzae]